MKMVNPAYFMSGYNTHLVTSLGCINPCLVTERLVLLCVCKKIDKLFSDSRIGKAIELMKAKKKFEVEVELAELSRFIRSGIAPCSMVSNILKQIQAEEERKTKQEVMF